MLAIIKQFVRRMLMGKGKGILQIPPQNKVDEFANDLFKKFKQNGVSDEAITNPRDVKIIWEQITNREAQILSTNLKDVLTPPLSSKKAGDVVDLTGKKIDTNKPILGGKNVPESEVQNNMEKMREFIIKNQSSKTAIPLPDIVADTIVTIKSKKPIDAMKEANLVIGRKGKYKNLTLEQSQEILMKTDEHIFKTGEFDPDDLLAGGGIAGMLGERTGYFRGALADTKAGKAMSPGTRADYSPGQGHRENVGRPPGGGDPGMTYTAPPAETGKYITKKKYPPSLRHPILREEARKKREEAAFESMWRGAPPSMGEREKMFRKQRTARLLEEQRIKDFDKKIGEREKLYPYADMSEEEFAQAHPEIYDFMKKDPAFNWETFKEVSFANPGETFQATGARDINLPLGRTDTKTLDLFMTPFRKTNYEMSSEGPFNKTKIMSDLEKAQVALHEMRHKKILTEPLLTAAQPPLAVEDVKFKQSMPGMIRDYPGPNLEMPMVYRHANPPGSKEEFSSPLGMHEVFNRFLDRQYGSLKTPSGPYFDKIWRDEWQPYAKEYEKILTEYDLSPVNLAGGGRTGSGLNYLLGEDDQNMRVPVGEGGRIGFKKGTKFDPSKRSFLKLAAGLASIPIVGKYFKWLKPLAKTSKVLTSVPIKAGVDGMPLWFKPLVNKVLKEGDDVTKKFGTVDREIVHKSTLPDSKTDVLVTQNLDTGDVVVDIGLTKHGFADGKFGQPVRLEYKASEVIEPTHIENIKSGSRFEKTGKPAKTKEEFWVEEAEFTGGHPENVKFEESTFNKFGKHESDFSEVEAFSKGKTKKVRLKQVDSLQKEGEDLADHFSNYPEPDDFASGGRVPMFAGGPAWKLWQAFIEKLFMKASTDIRRGTGLFKGLTQEKWIKKHDDLTNILKEWKMGGKKSLPKDIKEYFGMNEIQLTKAFKESQSKVKKSKVIDLDETNRIVDDLGTEMQTLKDGKTKSIIPKDEYAEYSKDFNKEILNMSPEDQLRDEFPGISDKLIRQILTDKNPQRIAEVKQTMREALEMQEKGMGHEEIINIFEKMKGRKPNATGGRVSLSSGGLAGMLGE